MDMSTDPYEQKLYQMFTSYDTDAKGSLDKDALSKLCKSLELKDRESILVSLLLNGNGSGRVTFKGFKEGLLNLLGTDEEEENDDGVNNDDPLKLQSTTTTSSDTTPGQQSPIREVSPKCIVGTKKYGRRSRPTQNPTTLIESSDSDTEEYITDPILAKSSTITPTTMLQHHHQDNQKFIKKVQRSSSHSDIHGSKRRRPGTGNKLKRCASLPAQKQKKDEKPLLQTQRESSVESLGNLDIDNLSHCLYDVWTDIGHGINNTLSRLELEMVCERVGLCKIASKVADEVYEKLALGPNCRISFNNFIALIQDGPVVFVPTTTDVVTEQTQYNQKYDYQQLNEITLSSSPIDNSGGVNDDNINILHNLITSSNQSYNIMMNNALSSASSHELHAISDKWPTESSAVPAEVIVDMWEAAGITNAKTLLDNLGFATKEIHISQLSLAIDDDMIGVQDEDDGATVSLLLRASLTLHKAEVSALQQAFKQLADENRKLHANNRDINRRAAILAQEIDERHAHLENSARTEIRQLEQRHADIVRDLTTQLATDREHWSNLNAKLEKRIKTLESDEAKLRSDLSAIQLENSALETDHSQMQQKVANVLEENVKLNYQLLDVVERQCNEESYKSDKDAADIQQLMDKIVALQLENSNLRDKNDELVTEVEEKCMEITKLKLTKKSQQLLTASQSDDFDEISEDPATNTTSATPTNSNSSIVLAATKRRGDSPSKSKIIEESPKLGKVRKCDNNAATDCESETSGDWMTLNSELNQSPTTTTATYYSATSKHASDTTEKDNEIEKLQLKIDELEQQKVAAENVADIKERNEELELCLEQMRKAYEDCEDYWQGKLNEERQLFEDEQRITNDKFNELVKKIAEYEEQYAASEVQKNDRLSPINENRQLEQQYAELEAEIDEIKCQARKMLEEKATEIECLQTEIKAMKRQLGRTMDNHRISDMDSPASSPISYLWHQSTIQAPARDYQNPQWNSQITNDNDDVNNVNDCNKNLNETSNDQIITPIQRPISPTKSTKSSPIDEDSVKSHSVASTHSIHRSFPDALSISPNVIREDIKRLKLFEIQLKDGIQELAHQRDCLVMEVEQLREVKPMLAKAYARANHPSLMQKIQQLEQKNSQLLKSAKQQQIYTENIMQQTWQQQSAEINELRHRLESQGIIIAEQAQRLANADMLVKDLYVENSQLSAAVQRLEQQRSRNNLILKHQGLTVVPGMPSI